jgi:hypothetical protein
VPPVGEGYRLQTLLELRRREEQERKSALALAVDSTLMALATQRAAEERRDAAAARRDEALRRGEAKVRRGGATAGDVVADRRWRKRLDEAVTAAEQTLAAAAGRAAAAQVAEAEARDALAQATRERLAVETHRETWLAEEKRAEERRAEAVLDDRARKD